MRTLAYSLDVLITTVDNTEESEQGHHREHHGSWNFFLQGVDLQWKGDPWFTVRAWQLRYHDNS